MANSTIDGRDEASATVYSTSAADLVRFALGGHAGHLVSGKSVARMSAPHSTLNESTFYGYGMYGNRWPTVTVLISGTHAGESRGALVQNATSGSTYAWLADPVALPADFDTEVRAALNTVRARP